MANGDQVAAVINWSGVDLYYYELAFGDIGLAPGEHQEVSVRDLWAEEELGTYDSGKLTIKTLKAHGTAVFRFRAVDKK